MKKIIPPILFVLCIAVMVGLWWLFPILRFIRFPLNLIGLLIFMFGIILAKCGSVIFEKEGTNISTFQEPDILVTKGLFRISRNPMYLGFFIALFGVFIFLGCLSPLFVTVVFFIVSDRWYIEFEEIAMVKKFGEEYLKYKTTTRRWL